MQLKKVSSYKNKAVKTTNSNNFPTYNMTGEASFYLSVINGTRNSGKTNTVINILNIEKDIMLKGANIVYWISGTKDDKVVSLLDKYPDNIKYYDTFDKNTVEEILDEISHRINKWEEHQFVFELFEKYLKNKNSIDEQEMNVLIESGILEDDADVKKMINEHNFQHPPISTLVIDDQLGSPLISGANSKDGKWFTKFIIKHRHKPHFCNVFILTQHFKMISKPIRANANNIIMFASKDTGIADSVFDEFAPLFKGKLENYHEALDLIEKIPHGFLNMWYDKQKFVRLNFDKQLIFD